MGKRGRPAGSRRGREEMRKWTEAVRQNGSIRAPKLTEAQQVEICDLLAQFKTSLEILQHFKGKYGLAMSFQAIEHYGSAPRWRPVIDRYRNLYTSYLSELPIYHRKIRLERLEQQYQQVLKPPENSKVFEKERRSELRAILNLARQELEPLEKEIRSSQTNIFLTQ